LIENISNQVYQFGPFKIDFRVLDLNAISSQVLGVAQSLLSRGKLRRLDFLCHPCFIFCAG